MVWVILEMMEKVERKIEGKIRFLVIWFGRENAVPIQALSQLGNHLRPSSESKPSNFNQQNLSNPQIVANKKKLSNKKH